VSHDANASIRSEGSPRCHGHVEPHRNPVEHEPNREIVAINNSPLRPASFVLTRFLSVLRYWAARQVTASSKRERMRVRIGRALMKDHSCDWDH